MGCGHMQDHKRREGIGIDLQRGRCDIIADIQFTPFREDAFNKIYARNVLEHIPVPFYPALQELNRVLAKNGKLSITIPVYHNSSLDMLIKFILGFPLMSYRTVKRLLKLNKNKQKRGFLHANKVRPENIAKIFTVSKVEQIYTKYPFFHFNLAIPFVQYVYASSKKTRNAWSQAGQNSGLLDS